MTSPLRWPGTPTTSSSWGQVHGHSPNTHLLLREGLHPLLLLLLLFIRVIEHICIKGVKLIIPHDLDII